MKISMSQRVERPPSEQLVDIHVYVVPSELWQERLRSALNQIISDTISAGFIRVYPEMPLTTLRGEIDKQLGFDIVPREFVFCRSVGRGLAQVRVKQENQMRVKYFLPPHSTCPEIFVLDSDTVRRSQMSSDGSRLSFVGQGPLVEHGRPSKDYNGYDSDPRKRQMAGIMDSDDEMRSIQLVRSSLLATLLSRWRTTHPDNDNDIHRLPPLATRHAGASNPSHSGYQEESSIASRESQKPGVHHPPRHHRSRHGPQRFKAGRDPVTRSGEARSEPYPTYGQQRAKLVRRPFSDLVSGEDPAVSSGVGKHRDIRNIMDEIQRRKREMEWLAAERERKLRSWEKESAQLEVEQLKRHQEQEQLEILRRREESILLGGLQTRISKLKDELKLKTSEFEEANNLIRENRQQDELGRLNGTSRSVPLEHHHDDYKKQIALCNPSQSHVDDILKDMEILSHEIDIKKGKLAVMEDQHRQFSFVEQVEKDEKDSLSQMNRELRSLEEKLDRKRFEMNGIVVLSAKNTIDPRNDISVKEDTMLRRDPSRDLSPSNRSAILRKNPLHSSSTQLSTETSSGYSVVGATRESNRPLSYRNSHLSLQDVSDLDTTPRNRRPSMQSYAGSEFSTRKREIDQVIEDIGRRKKELRKLEEEHDKKLKDWAAEENQRRKMSEKKRQEKIDVENARRKSQEKMLAKLKSDLDGLEESIDEKRKKMELEREPKLSRRSSCSNIQLADQEFESRRLEINSLNDEIERKLEELNKLDNDHQERMQTRQAEDLKREQLEKENADKEAWLMAQQKQEVERLKKEIERKRKVNRAEEVRLQNQISKEKLEATVRDKGMFSDEETMQGENSADDTIKDDKDNDVYKLEEERRRRRAADEEAENALRMQEEREKMEAERKRFENEQRRWEEERRHLEEEERRRLAEERNHRRDEDNSLSMDVPQLLIDDATPMRMGGPLERAGSHRGSSNSIYDDYSQPPAYLEGLGTKEQLLRELQLIRTDRLELEKRREDMMRRARQLHAKMTNKRSQARNTWKQRYYEEKKKTAPLETKLGKLRADLEAIHQKIIGYLENSLKEKSNNKPVGKLPPSYMESLDVATMRIQATRLQHEIEEVQRRVDDGKVRLTAEIKLRTQAESEMRAQKAELTQKKIQQNMQRSKQLVAMGTTEIFGTGAKTLIPSKN